MNRRRPLSWVPGAIGFAALLVSGLGPAVAQDTGRRVDASRYFRVESESGQNRRGTLTVRGYVYSNYGYNAGEIQLLIEGLDDQEQVTVKRVVPILGSVPPFGRLYFESPAPGAAAHYRVSVYWYEWIARGA